jgi:prepilin-type N-terminal cleavage/methylation domain-containing protein
MTFNRSRTQRRRRSGLSLIEVLLALAVFGVGTAALLHSVGAAQRLGGRAHFLNEAVLRCKQIHGQLESGVVAASQTSHRAFADDSRWSWSIAEEPVVETSLVRRTVTVVHHGSAGEHTFALTRIVAPYAPWQDAPSFGRGDNR